MACCRETFIFILPFYYPRRYRQAVKYWKSVRYTEAGTLRASAVKVASLPSPALLWRTDPVLARTNRTLERDICKALGHNQQPLGRHQMAVTASCYLPGMVVRATDRRLLLFSVWHTHTHTHTHTEHTYARTHTHSTHTHAPTHIAHISTHAHTHTHT